MDEWILHAFIFPKLKFTGNSIKWLLVVSNYYLSYLMLLIVLHTDLLFSLQIRGLWVQTFKMKLTTRGFRLYSHWRRERQISLEVSRPQNYWFHFPNGFYFNLFVFRICFIYWIAEQACHYVSLRPKKCAVLASFVCFLCFSLHNHIS